MKDLTQMTARDLQVRQEKLRVMHKGRCTSLRNTKDADQCPCKLDCPLHGRCCDCIWHHKEHLSQPDLELYSCGWAPNCVQSLVHDRLSPAAEGDVKGRSEGTCSPKS